MRDARIGRVLVASLHQGIADILPNRLTFYENWLDARGLRQGTIGVAPLMAVLSFLRQEGEAYGMITRRAGEYAAEWTVESLSAARRAAIKASPRWLRKRILLRIAGQLVHSSCRDSRAIAKLQRGSAEIDLRASIFCSVREPVARPLCGFYAAAVQRLMELFNIGAQTEVVACRGTGKATCVLHVALLALLLLIAAVPARAQTGVLVMPFENVRRDPRIFWLGEASAVLLTDNVNALGGDAVTRQERTQAFARLKVPPAAVLTDATLIRIGQVVGAAEIVVGTLQLDADVLTVRARTIALDTGRVQNDITERGPMGEMFVTFERIARRLAPPSQKTTAEIVRQHPRVDVFANFIKGLLSESPPTAINYLWAALKLEPTFERARLALWDVYANQNDYGHALDAVAAISPDSPNARRAQFLSGLAKLELKQYEDAFKILSALAETEPTAPVLNNLGVVQLRRFAPAQTGLPVYFFDKAAKADADDSDYAFNLGYAYWLSRDTQAAIYWLKEALRRNRADADAHFVLGTALAASGSASEAAREHELARRLSSEYEELDRRKPASNMVDGVPRGLERVKQETELPRARRIETRLAASEQRDQEDVARFHLDRGRRLYQQENDRDASIELDRALYLSPYLGDAHLLLGRIHLRSGRVHEAIDAFKISLWSAETADAHVALGEAYRQTKDLVAARAEADRALTLDPASADAKQLIARIEGK